MERKIIMSEEEYENINAQQNKLLELLDLFHYDLAKNEITIDKTNFIMDIVANGLKETYGNDGLKNITALYGSGRPVSLEYLYKDEPCGVDLTKTKISFK